MLNLSSKYNYINLEQNISSTFFSTPSVELSQQKSDIKAEEIEVSGVKVRKEQDSIHQNNVYFRDPFNNSYVNVGMSNENLSKLKNLFGANSVKSENNQFLLKNKAEEFVSSWYADIVYKRGYAQADENQDGFLDIEERKNTKSFSEGTLRFDGKNIFLYNDDEYYLKFSSINSQNTTRINQ